MSAIETRARLADTLRATGIRVVLDMGQSIDPPALVVTLPTLTYDAYVPSATEAVFKVALVVAAMDERWGDHLLALLPAVEQAIYDSDDAALTAAEPGSWGTPPLPCFLLTIEVSV